MVHRDLIIVLSLLLGFVLLIIGGVASAVAIFAGSESTVVPVAIALFGMALLGFGIGMALITERN